MIVDLHIHSRFSRATSKDLTIENLEKYAKIKGVDLLGTGDFTHPLWFNELKSKLKEENGILFTQSGFPFVLQTEICNIYSQDGKLRKIHNILLAKSLDVVEQVNELLSKKGNLKADGRPIFGSYNCIELVEDLMNIDKDIEIIPAHCLTPWFSIFGSMSGFDRVEDCFKEKTKYIHALETGMSADPVMINRVDNWNKFTLISNSDSHSYWPWRIGREANIFDINLSYNDLINAIRTRKGFKETVEVSPSYGKYHFDGHRLCNVCLDPKESIKRGNICPRCGRKLTIGVAHRVEELANHPEDYKPKDVIPFKRLIPLAEIISGVLNTGIATKTMWKVYNELINTFVNEFNVLLNISLDDLKKIVDEKIADAIIKNREGNITVYPGYDGEYGRPIFKGDGQMDQYKIEQKILGEF